MISLVPMMDDSYNSFGGDYQSDLDDSASTVKMSNRPHHRRSAPEARVRRMTEASRWESFPSGRRLAPPQRPITPPPSSNDAPPPPALRQESQGCLAPRVPQRKSSLEAIKRPTTEPTPPLRRHISDDSEKTAATTLRLPTRQPSFQG